MTYPQNDNAEMKYIPMAEIHMPHTWRCCWRLTLAEAFYTIVIAAGIMLGFWLALIINGQIDASLSI